jgi:hypothetical protein
MHSKFLTCYEAMGQVIWLYNFIHSLRVVDIIIKSLTLYCDNKDVVFFSHNNKSSRAPKHIDIKYLVAGERVQDHTINLEHISTKKIILS